MLSSRPVSLQAHIGDLKLHLLNSHLESTAEFARERVEQLKLAFTKMKGAAPGVTTLFGGDLNMRDKEVVQAGLPQGVVDLWEACGQRPECRYTWDTTRNTNKEIGKKGSGGIGVASSMSGPSTSSLANSLKRKR
ncbi:Tyrosyl-DNA phosphodiesterase 2 [Portunus trituberculatus]|uniref:Tyrosyl-DNA phosphodiesterase 2 n=1 Tax=Portunus trituberculatus TaxID=210409 RepID=A0A5B7D1X6_PORTR|nr:Tyrosyl-DNA phosphodiesterase 2 [Portunus trituberculatus]